MILASNPASSLPGIMLSVLLEGVRVSLFGCNGQKMPWNNSTFQLTRQDPPDTCVKCATRSKSSGMQTQPHRNGSSADHEACWYPLSILQAEYDAQQKAEAEQRKARARERELATLRTLDQQKAFRQEQREEEKREKVCSEVDCWCIEASYLWFFLSSLLLSSVYTYATVQGKMAHWDLTLLYDLHFTVLHISSAVKWSEHCTSECDDAEISLKNWWSPYSEAVLQLITLFVFISLYWLMD